jgi:hypothetical protein
LLNIPKLCFYGKGPLLAMSQENESLQTQVNIVPTKNDQESVNKRLQVLHAHRLF